MDQVEIVQQAVKNGIRNDMTFKILLMAAITARGYENVQMMLYQAQTELSNGYRPEEFSLDYHSMIYG